MHNQFPLSKLSRAAILLLAGSPALPSFAEGPMATDDAGTLGKGGAKIEAIHGRDHKARSNELRFGYGLIDNLEIGLSFARENDHDADPSTKKRATGLGIKWVPIQSDTGWSLGVSLGHDRTRVDERATPDRFAEEEVSFSALASHRLENGQVLHMNLGSRRTQTLADDDTTGERNTTGTWGIGYEFPLMGRLRLTVEAFGEGKSRPDKAVGLRHEIVEGLKLYGAVGRGNDRSFGNLGLAWEF